jgi:hypothetical protein
MELVNEKLVFRFLSSFAVSWIVSSFPEKIDADTNQYLSYTMILSRVQ